MEPPGKILLFSLHLTICGILHRNIWKCAYKRWTFSRTLHLKTLMFNSIIFSIYKNSIFYLCPDVTRFLKQVLSSRTRHLRIIILEGRGFRGGSDEKMRRMWLGLTLLWLAFLPLTRYPPPFMTHGYPNKRENTKTTLGPLRFPIVYESFNSAIYNFWNRRRY